MIASLAAIVLATGAKGSELTVYNQGFALVKENRSLTLKSGRQSVQVADVAAQLDPTSVAIKSLDGKDPFSILEQNYQYDLISPEAILDKSVGQRVRFIRTVAEKRDVLEGTLISSPTAVVDAGGGQTMHTYNGMVIRTDDGRIILNPTGEVEVTEVPAGLISKPTLQWEIEAAQAAAVPIELSYITQGISWSSDYVLTLDGAGQGALQGWVTIQNSSGASYENAKLKLLAGDVNVATPTSGAFGGIGGARRAFSAAAKDQFQEQSLFEYHLYTLQRPATVRNKETKQISLLEAPEVKVTKRLIIDGELNVGHYYPAEGEIGTGDIKPQVRIEFKNTKANGLGIPLPKGRIRLYQRDDSGSVQLLGEDNIAHTPREETLSLVVGHAFDIVATRLRTNFTRVNDRSVQETFEIEVRNRKDSPENLEVIERHYGDWKILKHSHDFKKTSAESMVFPLSLKPNETQKVVYTVQTTW